MKRAEILIERNKKKVAITISSTGVFFMNLLDGDNLVDIKTYFGIKDWATSDDEVKQRVIRWGMKELVDNKLSEYYIIEVRDFARD